MKYWTQVTDTGRKFENDFSLGEVLDVQGLSSAGFSPDELIAPAPEVSQQEAYRIVNRWNRYSQNCKYWVEE